MNEDDDWAGEGFGKKHHEDPNDPNAKGEDK